ncbi:hypothetical protein [Pyrococcus kukulkanii]|uniref:hypothetical protein n=1 Tax=Pyrococcus kukulkanii TaxID=1609559 RepID=UPI00356A6090
MIEWVRYKDLYFPILRTIKNKRLATVIMYYIHKEGKITRDELVQLVASDMNVDKKTAYGFAVNYLRKLKGYNFVREENGFIVPQTLALPADLVVKYVISKEYGKRAKKAWKRRERYPSPKTLAKVNGYY